MVVVLFRNRPRETVDAKNYGQLGLRLREIVSHMPGFISLDVFNSAEGETLILGTFASDDAAAQWRQHPDHKTAQGRRNEFYDQYTVQVCSVIRAYGWQRDAVER